jgi:hypothetical protein
LPFLFLGWRGWEMGVEGRRDETELVEGLYPLKVGMMRLRSLKFLLLVPNVNLMNKRIERSKEWKRDDL